jgi:SAM-dependent methyltransferase
MDDSLRYKYQSANQEIGLAYDRLCEKHGRSSESVAWLSKHDQDIRFLVASLVGDIDQGSVLDVGCGQGNFLGYLKQENISTKYAGIDISQKMIDIAREDYPEHDFRCIDFLDPDFQEHFDYIIASGSFNLKFADYESYLKDVLDKLFHLSRVGVSLNLLSSYAPDHRKFERTLYYHDPRQILDLCFQLTHRVALRHDYLSNDFTVYLYH